MNWIPYFGLLVPLIAFFGFLYRELKDWMRETRDEILSIREGNKQQAIRSDRLYVVY